MDLRYISYAGGNFRSCAPVNRPAAPRSKTEPKPAAKRSARARAAPIAAAAAEALSAPPPPEAQVPAPRDFDLVLVDELRFEPDQPRNPPLDLEELFAAMSGAAGAASDAVAAPPAQVPAPAAPASAKPAEVPAPADVPAPAATAAEAAPPPPPAKAELSQAERTAQTVARLAERRAREAARHAEREAERRARKEAAAAARAEREEADKARETAESAAKKTKRTAKAAKRSAKAAERHAKDAQKETARRRRALEREEKRAASRSAPRTEPSPAARRSGAFAANAASALGIVAAVGASIWYFAGGHGRFERETRMSAAVATVVPPADAAAAAPRAALPQAPQAALLSLAAIESQTERRSFQQVVRVQRGEFFRDLLMRNGVNGAEAQLASISLSGVYDVRKMRPGQLVTVDFGILRDEHNRFLGVRFDSNFDRTVAIQRQSRGDFVATEIKKDIVTQLLRTNGAIDHSVFQAGLQAGLPPEPVVRMINLFAYDVDFQRDVQRGDLFETLIEQHRDPRGDIVRHGNILFASLTLQGQTIRLYRWQADDGEVDYFSETGHSSRKALMRTPIDGARLSSGFGYRRHPILGYSKMHQGVDFQAPTGTPIFAAGSGQIDKMGWQGGYGISISIRHNKDYSTLYGHLSGFAPGIGPGKRVKQGDVIGYVGSTGLSTGPHLHYEVHLNGKQIDPLSLKLPSRQRLAGAELKRYLDYVAAVDTRFQALAKSGATGTAIASAQDQEADSGCVNGARLDPTDKRACE